MEKWKFISIHAIIRTYGENGLYIFVDFRSKRACCSKYRGACFARPSKKPRAIESRILNKEYPMSKYNLELRDDKQFEKTKPISYFVGGMPYVVF